MLIRRLKCKIFLPPDNKRYKHIIINAGGGCYFPPSKIDNEIERIANKLEKDFPNMEFRLAQTAKDSFNFIFDGYKAIEPEQEKAQEEIAQENKKEQ